MRVHTTQQEVVLYVTFNKRQPQHTPSTKTSQKHNPQPTRHTQTIPTDDGDYREGQASSSRRRKRQRCHAAVAVARPVAATQEAKEGLTPAAGEETVLTAALAQWARLPRRGVQAGAALTAVPEGVNASCWSKMAPWAIEMAERARRRQRGGVDCRGGGERGRDGSDTVAGWVAVAVDDKDEDDGSGRQYRATTDPMMVTMVAGADNNGDGGRRQQ
jgi:hypothetical protein